MLRFWFLAAIGLLASLVGCSRPPAVEFENLHLVSSLRTACSAQNEQWLAGVAKAVDVRQQSGRMSAVERQHFDRIIELARAGKWDQADQACYQFEKAQLNRSRTRPAADEHSHDHQQAGSSQPQPAHVAGH